MLHAGAQTVRLSDSERKGICDAVSRSSKETGVNWRRVILFGSRADLARRGGDIDLLVEVGQGDHYRFTQRLRIALEDALGEQKIDIVLDDGNSASAFIAIAKENGVDLWIND